VVNLGRDDESDPEEDSHAENIDYDYDYDPESPARNFPQSEECEEKREKEYHVIEKMLHFANLLSKR